MVSGQGFEDQSLGFRVLGFGFWVFGFLGLGLGALGELFADGVGVDKA